MNGIYSGYSLLVKKTILSLYRHIQELAHHQRCTYSFEGSPVEAAPKGVSEGSDLLPRRLPGCPKKRRSEIHPRSPRVGYRV